ncbi:hypothetical protein EMIT048CA2_20154 [Pseudomonas chlororaphis]
MVARQPRDRHGAWGRAHGANPLIGLGQPVRGRGHGDRARLRLSYRSALFHAGRKVGAPLANQRLICGGIRCGAALQCTDIPSGAGDSHGQRPLAVPTAR